MNYTSPRFAVCMLAILIVTFLQIPLSNAQISGSIGLSAPQPLFRGKIIYKGTYSGTAVVPAQGGSSIRGGGINFFIPNTTTHELAGAITFELEFNGQAVTGTYTTTGPVRPDSFSGLVNADGCTLTGRDGGIFKGLCGTATFNGIAQSPPGARDTVRAQFQTTVSQVVDYDERDRIEAEAASQRQAAAEAARVARERQAVQRGAVASPSASKSGNTNSSQAQPNAVGTTTIESEARSIKLAQDGNAMEMLRVGMNYFDHSKFLEAAKWFKMAADAGNMRAASSLAVMYAGYDERYDRLGNFPVDHKTAWSWMKRAAELGDSASMFFLGYGYETGKLWKTSTMVVGTDPKLALLWYKKAAALGDKDAKAKVTELTITPAQKLARENDRKCIEAIPTFVQREEPCYMGDVTCGARRTRTETVSTGNSRYKNNCNYNVAVLFKKATSGMAGIFEIFDPEEEEEVLKPGESSRGSPRFPDEVRRVP